MLILRVFNRLRVMFLFIAMALCLAGLTLFLLSQVVTAAPPEVSVVPPKLTYLTTLAITPTKSSVPFGVVQTGQILTYTIAFTADNQTSTVVITDPVPGLTDFAGTITGTPAASITTGIIDNTIVWTVTDVITDNTIVLTFTVRVSDSATFGAYISNTAWISDATAVIATNLVTHRIIASDTVYLPIIMKPDPNLTNLYVQSDNTGGINPLEIRKDSDNSLVKSCTIGNNTTTYCTSFVPGTYKVLAYTANCGLLQGTNTFVSGPKTIRVYCN